MSPSLHPSRPSLPSTTAPLRPAFEGALGASATTAVFVFDETFTILAAGGGAIAVGGLTQDMLIGRRAQDVLPAESWARLEPAYRSALDGHDGSCLLRSADGERWYRVVTHPIPGDVPTGISISTRIEPAGSAAEDRPPLTEHRSAAAPLLMVGGMAGGEIFEVAFQQAATGMSLVDRAGRFIRVNPALCTMLGRAPNDLLGSPFQDFTHPDDLDLAGFGSLVEGETDRLVVEQRYLHGDGRWITTMLATAVVRDGRGKAQMYVSQVIDISGRKADEERLRRMAVQDPLTGLANRRGIETALDEMATARRPAAALLVDIDAFRSTNDGFGHRVGDRLLTAVAQRISDCVGPADVVGRIGADEFVVVMPDVTAADAATQAAELCEWIASTCFSIDATRAISPTASIGVALVGDASEVDDDDRAAGDSAAILLAADIAKGYAKEKGGNQSVVYGGAVAEHARANDDLKWLAELRRALSEHRFELHAQAIVDLTTGVPVKHELLLRLRGDDGQLIFPGAFMPAAERLRLMRDLDVWVVSEAADYANRYPGMTLGVNLSGSSVSDPGLAGRIEGILDLAGCDPAQIVFEITETEAIDNLGQARELADQLIALGCRFALDDFGAGYASFSHLKKLPVEFVKIDGQFVRHLATDADDQLIVRAIHTVAEGMGRKVIAEQIEDEATADLLRAMGVPFAQGYFFGRPQPIDDVLGAAMAQHAGAPQR